MFIYVYDTDGLVTRILNADFYPNFQSDHAIWSEELFEEKPGYRKQFTVNQITKTLNCHYIKLPPTVEDRLNEQQQILNILLGVSV